MRIKDASSLVLIDQRGDCPRILMGRRSAKHHFMPSVYVFPGGQVDYADRFAPYGPDYEPDTLDLLLQQMKGRPTALRARMIGLAALRETFEEVGLMLGATYDATLASARPHKHPIWNDFKNAGLMPDLSSLSYIARAITPPGRNRRFDTRFFMVNATPYLTTQTAQSSDELEDVQWVRFEQTHAMPLHFITRQIVATAQRALEHQTRKKEGLPVAFYRAKPGASTLAKTITYLRAGQPPQDSGELID